MLPLLAAVSLLLTQTPEEVEAIKKAGLTDAAVAKMSGDQIHDVLTQDRPHGDPPAVAIVAVIGFFGTSALMIIAVAWAVYRIYRQRSETLRLMVEKGVPIPPELIAPKPKPGGDLRRGLILSTFGVGLGIFLASAASERGLWTLGFVPLLVGLGYLAAHRAIKPDAPSKPDAAPAAAS
jgi:hypothetical protein